MKYNFDKVIPRENTNSMKWEFMDMMSPDTNKDTLAMWVADMDFACPSPIIDALHKRVDRLIFGYTCHETDEFYDSITSWFSRRFDWSISNDEIFIASGVVPAISKLIKLFTKKDDGIIIQTPVYYPFASTIRRNNRKLVTNPLINNNGYYTMDFEDLLTKVKDDKNTMLVLCSPHNPVGRVWTKEELTRLGEICLENNVMIVSDEIHCDLVRSDITHYILASLFDDNAKIITCTATSKTFNIAGLQAANIFIKNEYLKKIYVDNISFDMISPFAITATEAAYNLCEDWVDEVNVYIQENVKYINDFIQKKLSKAKNVINEGTYLVWIDLNEYGYSRQEIEDLMIKGANVLFDMGHIFGSEGAGFIRINVACPKSIVIECMDRVYKVLA